MISHVAQTRSGAVRGAERDGIVSFRGIPFAAAPVGPLRFRPPVPPAAWDGVRDAVAFGAAPPQPGMMGGPSAWNPAHGLDCLTLNVYSPDLGAVGLPVMVWIYGGMFRIGSSGAPHYDGTPLASGGVVVVTINYRLGFDGWGHLPGVPDNRGLLDQIAALHWVRDNIAGFGGDPDNVTVFGQSAGGASVALLTAAPATEGLFRRAIAQSVPRACQPIAKAEATTAALADAAGVPATWDGFAALAPETIVAIPDSRLTGLGEHQAAAFGPVIDGDLVIGPPWVAGPRPAVDLICGFTHEEYRGQAMGMDFAAIDEAGVAGVAGAFGLGPDAVAAYRAARPAASNGDLFVEIASDGIFRLPTARVALAHAGAGGRTWLYDVTWSAAAIGAGHLVDVPLVFGVDTGPMAARVLGTPPPDGFAELSAAMRAAWTAFAATGDPGWPRFLPEDRRTRLWDLPPADVDYPLADSERIWAAAEGAAAS